MPRLTDLKAFQACANQVISFKIVGSAEDIDDENIASFPPKMSYQVFGDGEVIFGYRGLKVTIYVPYTLECCFVDIKYDESVQCRLFKPDDISAKLEPFLPKKQYYDKEEFLKVVENLNSSVIYGRGYYQFKTSPENSGSTYYVMFCSNEEEGFVRFHSNFESFVIWYIDAANYIDLDDTNWHVIYLYEYSDAIYRPIGFCTLYKFYMHPATFYRLRISQFFVLPPYQGRGIGKRFLACILRLIKTCDDVGHVTVESPCDQFRQMRDVQNVREVLKNEAIVNLILNEPSCNNKVRCALANYTISKIQAQKIYDIILFPYVNESEATYQMYFERIMRNISRQWKKKTFRKGWYYHRKLSKKEIPLTCEKLIKDTCKYIRTQIVPVAKGYSKSPEEIYDILQLKNAFFC